MISQRQEDILAAIVEHYADVASPVGSVTLAKLFNVSPATIRAEMARLEELGFIMQPHTSAGRVPTDKGYRAYVNKISEEKLGLQVVTPRSHQMINRRVEHAGEPVQAIKSAVQSLVELTHNAAWATMGTTVYLRGLEQLFAQPEFMSGEGIQNLGYLIDNMERWLREATLNEPLSVYIGRENPIGRGSNCSLIISKFRSPYSDDSYVGVLGPTRQNYRSVMNLVQRTADSLEEALV